MVCEQKGVGCAGGEGAVVGSTKMRPAVDILYLYGSPLLAMNRCILLFRGKGNLAFPEEGRVGDGQRKKENSTRYGKR